MRRAVKDSPGRTMAPNSPSTRPQINFDAYFFPRAHIRIKDNYNVRSFMKTVAISPVELAV